MPDVSVRIDRIVPGPALVIENATALAREFFRLDPSSAPGGYDDQGGRVIHTA